MSLVPRTTLSDFDRPRGLVPPDINFYPYLWDDPTYWWTRDYIRSMDELVSRRVRNQLIRTTPYSDWAWPMRWQNYYAGERVYVNEKGFQVDIDVRPFKPHEIVVKTTDDYVVVEGNHDKRLEYRNNDFVERHFVRKYLLPRGFNPAEVISNLSADGILTIKAPPPPPTKYYNPGERLVRVHETGKPSLPWK